MTTRDQIIAIRAVSDIDIALGLANAFEWYDHARGCESQESVDEAWRELEVIQEIAEQSLTAVAPSDDSRLPHATVPVLVWADVDLGIADMVRYLNTIPGVRTEASCQGTIGEGGPHPFRAQVMAAWDSDELEQRLASEFDITRHGIRWGFLHPREGWKPKEPGIDAISRKRP